MVQMMPVDWQIVSQSGAIVVKNIKIATLWEAEDYVRRYISSYHGVTYRMIPLKTKDMKDE